MDLRRGKRAKGDNATRMNWHGRSTELRWKTMSVAEVSKLPLREKLQIMEAIWQDLRERADEVDVPLEQRRLLDARRERVTAGNSRLLDWDEAKLMIGKK
ncbi:hypothetical protein FEM03_15680 [Phragmitibacter flavus]|uniref:Addiction module protein n=2 Tax=Phragmitibacter flavus TaxID=2576071 RepID=A0A5R8KBT1_9BACT|nr:hypothetical protein FEM03_15680 [Phragmitibacter flavus]